MKTGSYLCCVTTDPTTDDRTQLVDRLNAADLPVVDMTDNELAKLPHPSYGRRFES